MSGDANAAARPINYGMFIMPYHPSSKPLAQCFDEDVELVVRAEELGFDEFWIGEHHTMRFEPIVVPEVFIGRVLGVTERIRLGAAPVCLNLHHPAYVATRLAFLDHLSKGRLNLCFGPNSVSTDMELYGQHPKDGGAMTVEALDAILHLWASDPPYHHEGKFWQFSLEENVDEATGIGFVFKPLQQPHPPIAMPGISRNSGTLTLAGQRGYAPFSAALATGNVLADNWATYARAAAEAGREADPGIWKVCRAIFLADTTEEAVKLARNNSVGGNYEYIASLHGQFAGAPGDPETRSRHAGRRLQHGFLAQGADHRRGRRRGAPAVAGAHGRERTLRHPGSHGLRLGRQGELDPQPGAVRQRADARLEQGRLRRHGMNAGANSSPGCPAVKNYRTLTLSVRHQVLLRIGKVIDSLCLMC